MVAEVCRVEDSLSNTQNVSAGQQHIAILQASANEAINGGIQRDDARLGI